MSALGYGAANLGNLHRAVSDEESWEVLQASWDAGIRYFDTAPHYGLGLSERRLGEFLQTKPRDEFVLSTKVGRLLRPNPDDDGGLDLDNAFHVRTTLRREWDFSAQGIRASLDDSLQRMGLDRVDILFLHDPEKHDLNLAVAEAYPAMIALREAGTVSGVGIGSMSAQALQASVTDTALDTVMIAGRYTLLEQPAASTLDACTSHRARAVIASVFNSGLLATATPSREDRYEYGGVPEDVWQRLQRLLEVCREHQVNLPAAAVQYPLRHPAVASVVIGSSRATQMRQNAALVAEDIPEAFWAALASQGLIPR